MYKTNQVFLYVASFVVFFSLYYYLFVDSSIIDDFIAGSIIRYSDIFNVLVPIVSILFCSFIILHVIMIIGGSSDDSSTKREIRKAREKHRKQLERPFKYKPKSSYSYLATDIVEEEVDEKKQKKTKKKELTMKTYSTGERDWDKV